MTEDDPAKVLLTLRQAGADRVDPVGMAFAEALARRLSVQPDAIRARLSPRLATLCTELQAGIDRPAPGVRPAPGAPSPLAELLAHLAGSAGETRLTPHARTDLKSLHHFRDTWSRLSIDQQLAEALQQGPENAGPLNSHRLILQTLQWLNAAAPDYLKHLISYADALLWLEQYGADVPTAAPGRQRDAPRRPRSTKRAAGAKRT